MLSLKVKFLQEIVLWCIYIEKISIDKSRLVDYDSFSWREYDI